MAFLEVVRSETDSK